jgi:aspartate racemase
MSFRSLLQQVRERALGAYAHADLPFNHLIAELSPARDLSRSPLFQVMFVLHDPDGISEVSRISGRDQLETGTSKFDLTLSIIDMKNGLDASIEYSTDLFTPQTIQRIGKHFGTLLEAIGSNPDENVSKLTTPPTSASMSCSRSRLQEPRMQLRWSSRIGRSAMPS